MLAHGLAHAGADRWAEIPGTDPARVRSEPRAAPYGVPCFAGVKSIGSVTRHTRISF